MSSDQNLVMLTGSLKYPEYNETANGYPRFNGKLQIRKEHRDGTTEFDGIRLCAWGDLAEVLGILPIGTKLKITGTLTSRSYKGSCRGCGGAQMKYWYEVLVDNFIVL